MNAWSLKSTANNARPVSLTQEIIKLPAAHAAQAIALRELQGILAKANKRSIQDGFL
jgi:hypothetical protein